jgi:hypothetical protein
MNHALRPFLLTFFPLTLLALAAAERTATWLLGAFPSSPALWAVWSELRAPLRDVLPMLDAGHPASLQMAAILAVATMVLAAASTRRWERWTLLVNHVALIVCAVSVIVTARSSVVSAGLFDMTTETFFAVNGQLTGLHLALLALGTLSCAACHHAFLAGPRRTASVVALRLAQLQHRL